MPKIPLLQMIYKFKKMLICKISEKNYKMAQFFVHKNRILFYRSFVIRISLLLFEIVKYQGEEGSGLTIFHKFLTRIFHFRKGFLLKIFALYFFVVGEY